MYVHVHGVVPHEKKNTVNVQPKINVHAHGEFSCGDHCSALRTCILLLQTCCKSLSVMVRRSLNSTWCSLNSGMSFLSPSPIRNNSRSPQLDCTLSCPLAMGSDTAGRVVEVDDVTVTSLEGGLHVYKKHMHAKFLEIIFVF